MQLNLRQVEGQVRRCLDGVSYEIVLAYQGQGLFLALMHVLQGADQTLYEVIFACQSRPPLVKERCRRQGWHLVEAESPMWPSS